MLLYIYIYINNILYITTLFISTGCLFFWLTRIMFCAKATTYADCGLCFLIENTHLMKLMVKGVPNNEDKYITQIGCHMWGRVKLITWTMSNTQAPHTYREFMLMCICAYRRHLLVVLRFIGVQGTGRIAFVLVHD